ncbi:hypothetical protein LJC19_04710 [Oxalobacter sp. OttesenSCG-928-P03]|nr:hypothetical protein [Oxalobacter sp. OttesenSCG-928-P03]
MTCCESIHFDVEEILKELKWFDYRFMKPNQATLLFARHYVCIYKEFYAKTKSVNGADDLDFNFLKDMAGALRDARRAADRIGCRYGFYIRFAFNRAFEQASRFLPLPGKLCEETLVLDVADAWERWTKVSLQLAGSEHYLNKNHRPDCPHQAAYHTYLIEQVKQREQPHIALYRVMCKEEMLPEDIARKHFSEDVMKKALSSRP